MYIEVKDLNHFDDLLLGANDQYVIVDCWATWCGPCMKIEPLYKELSKSFSKMLFLKVDSDENNESIYMKCLQCQLL